MDRDLKTNSSSSWTSKANHSQIVNDEYIQNFLKECKFPSKPSIDETNTNEVVNIIKEVSLGEKHILTVDGSYTTVSVRKDFPSSQIAFFQFGAILFTTEDLKSLSDTPFISPQDMNKLHNLQRIKLALPIKNIVSNNQRSLNESIRKAIYDFFIRETSSNTSYMETLSWLVFEEYSDELKNEYVLASNPNINSESGRVLLNKSEMKSNYTFDTPEGVIYLTDIFRLHEVIDEDFGASGILGYISRLLQQVILFHYLKIVYLAKASALNDFMFISNGPLSFSGQTANMHKIFRNLCNYLLNKRNLFLVGIEKSGAFVDHATTICTNIQSEFYLKKNNYLILSNDYIYNYITLGDPNRMHYGNTSYYGGKVIVHTKDSQIFVITVPIAHADVIKSPSNEDYQNLNEIIEVIRLLKCDIYEDSIIPVAIANKLISLSSKPSQSILEKFANSLI